MHAPSERPDHGHRPPQPAPAADPAAPPTPRPPAQAGPAQSVGRARPASHGNTAYVPVHCTGPAGTQCTVTLTEQVAETLRGSKLIAVQAGARHKRVKTHRRTVTVATGRASIAVGQDRDDQDHAQPRRPGPAGQAPPSRHALTVKLGRQHDRHAHPALQGPRQEAQAVNPRPGRSERAGRSRARQLTARGPLSHSPAFAACPTRAGLLAAGLHLPGGEADRDRPGAGRPALRVQPIRPGDGGGGQPRHARRRRPRPGLVPAQQRRRSRRCSSRAAPMTAPTCHARRRSPGRSSATSWRGARRRRRSRTCGWSTRCSRVWPALDPEYSFVPRWRPPFVSRLAGEDRCHLNGVGMRDGRPALSP